MFLNSILQTSDKLYHDMNFIVSDNEPLLYSNEKKFAWLAYRELQVASCQDTNDSDSELIHNLSL